MVLKGKYQVTELAEDSDRFLIFHGCELSTGSDQVAFPDADLRPHASAGAVTIRVLKDPVPEGFLEQYTRELAITQRLCPNPQILRYLDVDVIGNRYCVITESFDHPSLQRLFRERRRISYSGILNVLKSLIRLLEAAQMEGLSERHLRNEDILVDVTTGETRVVKLSIPRSLAVVGPSGPRRASAGVIRDVFFVGCSLFRMMVQDYPFSKGQFAEAGALERLEEACKAHFPDVEPPEIARLQSFFMRCSTSEIGERWLTYDDVAKEIEHLESLNAQISKTRRLADLKSRRKRRHGLLQTAFDTVAALRGELQAPKEDSAPSASGRERRPIVPERARPNIPTSRSSADRDSAERGTIDPTSKAGADVAPVQGEPPATVPSRREIGALLWDRVRQAESHSPLWDEPIVLKTATIGGVALFLGMLFWLLFGH